MSVVAIFSLPAFALVTKAQEFLARFQLAQPWQTILWSVIYGIVIIVGYKMTVFIDRRQVEKMYE
jgi:hypothetical protein